MPVTFADKDNTQPLSDPRRILTDDNVNELKNTINAVESSVSNVDNTPDTGKPVSTAQQTAIDLRLLTSRIVIGEIPTGTINNVNTVFTIANADPTFIMVYADGVRVNTSGFNVSGTTLTMVTPPDNSLLIDCIKS